jgi:hypothetical protein
MASDGPASDRGQNVTRETREASGGDPCRRGVASRWCDRARALGGKEGDLVPVRPSRYEVDNEPGRLTSSIGNPCEAAKPAELGNLRLQRREVHAIPESPIGADAQRCLQPIAGDANTNACGSSRPQWVARQRGRGEFGRPPPHRRRPHCRPRVRAGSHDQY